MARLLVIGASQGIGLATVEAALAAGHTVRAFARQASKIARDDAPLDTIDGDARDPAAVGAALVGCDAVVQSLGVPLTPATVLSGTRLFSEATRVLVDRMEAMGPQRLIVVTGVGAGDSRDALGPLYRAAFELSLRRIYDDKDVQEMIVRRSRLAWTLLRPGFLTDGQAGGQVGRSTGGPATARVLMDRNDWRAGAVSRRAVADVIVRHWDDPAFVRQAPVLIDA
jgi:putative NADH-flavin reductase